MSVSAKNYKFNQYDVTISRLFKLILNLDEEQKKALLQKGEELHLTKSRAPRKPCRMPVIFTTFDRMYSDHLLNISQSGAFIATRRPIFVGEEILINLQFEGIHKPLNIKGEVVHTSRSGIGIEFKNVNLNLSKTMANALDHMKS